MAGHFEIAARNHRSPNLLLSSMPHPALNGTWNEIQTDNMVCGDAVEFSQVVTQTRNIADTSLEVTGGNAAQWMARAQCFAGAPENPPAKGARHKI